MSSVDGLEELKQPLDKKTSKNGTLVLSTKLEFQEIINKKNKQEKKKKSLNNKKLRLQKLIYSNMQP